MALFRKKNKIQLLALKTIVARAIYHKADFPTVDITVTVADRDEQRRSDLTEVIISMTLWEAAQMAQQLHNAVSAGNLVMPHRPIHVPWGGDN